MSIIPKYLLNKGRGGGGGGLYPSNLKTVGFDTLIIDPLHPVGNVEFGYQQQAQGYPGGYLYVGQQRVGLRTVNGEPLIGNTDIQITGDANMVSITWSDLKTLRDGGQLVPGTWYRITDYTCTTSQSGTYSAEHDFDIIVRADTPAILNENAYAALHDDDSYFASSNLAAWRLKYCLDNDTLHFSWAMASTQTPYIVTDGEILYLSYEGAYWEYRGTKPGIGDIFLYTSPNPNVGDFAYENQDLTGRSSQITEVGVKTEENGKGVIYWMRDEHDNEAPYDFKNILFTRWGVAGIKTDSGISKDAKDELEDMLVYAGNNPVYYCINVDQDEYCGITLNASDKVSNRYYTFGGGTDRSTESGGACRGNVIKAAYGNDGKRILNNGVWVKNNNKVDDIKSTTCGYGCTDWTCVDDCSGFTCGDNCKGFFCLSSRFWTCGCDCFNFFIGTECDSWTCGNKCTNWTCLGYCSKWTCGQGCSWWIPFEELDSSKTVNCFHVLNGTSGSQANILYFSGIAVNAAYSQYIGYTSQGQARVFVLADLT